jgi:hypothetical protein
LLILAFIASDSATRTESDTRFSSNSFAPGPQLVNRIAEMIVVQIFGSFLII